MFANNSTAGSAFIDLDHGSFLQFANNSTAANSTIGTFFLSHVQFLDNSTAGSAFISVLDGSSLVFADRSTAASANIFDGNGFIFFEGSSRGGTAQIHLRFIEGLIQFFPVLAIDHGVTIGSLEGDEMSVVGLGANNLT